MIATHSENGRYHALVRVYATSTSYIYEIAFSAGLNGLQVDQVDKENDKRASTYAQFSGGFRGVSEVSIETPFVLDIKIHNL